MKVPSSFGCRRFSKHAVLLLASTALFVVLAVGVVGRQRIASFCAQLLGREAAVVRISYDPNTGVVTHVGNVRIQNDDEMVLRLQKGRPVVIAATPEVPWQDVVHFMDLCKQAGVGDLRFED